MQNNIRCLQNWISKKTCIYIIWLSPGFIFKSGGFFQLPFISQHIQIEIKFGGFMYMTLAVQSHFIGIESRSNIFCQYPVYISL